MTILDKYSIELERTLQKVDRQERRLKADVRQLSQLQGAMDVATHSVVDYAAVKQGEVTAVNFIRRERDGAKSSETRLQQELAAARAVLKRKVIVYDIFPRQE